MCFGGEVESEDEGFADWISYIPAIGRFLIVCTFIEDALRIMTQWSDQLLYLHDYRHSKYSLSYLLKLSITNTENSASPMGPHSPLPPHQCHCNDLLLHPRHHPQIPRGRSLWPHWSGSYPSPWLRPHLRPQLLPPQLERHGRSHHGPK